MSFTELCLDDISYLNEADLWYHSMRVEDDGTVWLMMLYDKEVVIYRLSF